MIWTFVPGGSVCLVGVLPHLLTAPARSVYSYLLLLLLPFGVLGGEDCTSFAKTVLIERRLPKPLIPIERSMNMYIKIPKKNSSSIPNPHTRLAEFRSDFPPAAAAPVSSAVAEHTRHTNMKFGCVRCSLCHTDTHTRTSTFI